jgi:hypothetical protein
LGLGAVQVPPFARHNGAVKTVAGRDYREVQLFEQFIGVILLDRSGGYVLCRSEEAGLAAVKYIYGEGEKAGAKPKKPCKWVECRMYEI